MTKGYVYIMEAKLGLCKVGVTKNFPEFRKLQISNDLKIPLTIRGYYICEKIYKVEKIIHRFLEDFRVEGEWFNLTYENIVETLSPTFEFKEYKKEDIPKLGLSHKLTVYISVEAAKLLNEICSKKVLETGRPDKSALITRSIELLYEEHRG